MRNFPTREMVESLATGTLSEEDAFETLPGNVRDFIKKEADKRKLELEADEYRRKFIYGDWGATSVGSTIGDGTPLSGGESWGVKSVLDCLREMCEESGMTEEPTEVPVRSMGPFTED